jgi:hypothetical protein
MRENLPPEPQLPALVMTPSDVTRLLRELDTLDQYMRQQGLRAPGQPTAKMPKTTRLLDELAVLNGVNLLDVRSREYLSAFLSAMLQRAPVVHISFAVDPSPAFLQKVVLWFRKNIHSQILVRVGLQPSIAAGCVVRTTNRYFDLSLRQHLQKQRGLLRDAIMALNQPQAPPTTFMQQPPSSPVPPVSTVPVPVIGQGLPV